MSDGLFYLSFADPELPEGSQWLGAAIVSAINEADAALEARRLGCNPGGEVMILDVSGAQVKATHRNRLLGQAEVDDAVER